MSDPARTLVGLLLASLGCASAQEPTPASIDIDGTRATVRGIVQQNVTRCEVDGPCYLVLRAGDGAAIHVGYHHGEYPPCENRGNVRVGTAAAAGDAIEATGLYSLSNRVHTVDVCCPDCRLHITRSP